MITPGAYAENKHVAIQPKSSTKIHPIAPQGHFHTQKKITSSYVSEIYVVLAITHTLKEQELPESALITRREPAFRQNWLFSKMSNADIAKMSGLCLCN